MYRMALSALIRERGCELTGQLLSEIVIKNGQVATLVETFIVESVELTYHRDEITEVNFYAVQLISEIAVEVAREQGDDEPLFIVLDLYPQGATSAIILPDGRIWFKVVEDDKDWCIHSPDCPVMPGHTAPKLA